MLDITLFLLIQLPDVACCVARASDVSSFLIFTSVPARRLGYVFFFGYSFYWETDVRYRSVVAFWGLEGGIGTIIVCVREAGCALCNE